jgi:hypothetical protein
MADLPSFPSTIYDDNMMLLAPPGGSRPRLSATTELALMGVVPLAMMIKINRLRAAALNELNKRYAEAIEQVWPKRRREALSALRGIHLPDILQMQRSPNFKTKPPGFEESLDHLGDAAPGIVTGAVVDLQGIDPRSFYELIVREYGVEAAERMVPQWNSQAAKEAQDAGRIQDPDPLFAGRTLSHHQLLINLYGPDGQVMTQIEQLPSGNGSVASLLQALLARLQPEAEVA